MKPIPKILIVEDEPMIAEDLADICLGYGYELCGTAFSGRQAFPILEDCQPNLLLLDINLGESLSGLELAAYVKQNYLIPFIFITAYADSATLANVRALDPLGFIVKPFNKEQVYSTIEIAWEKQQQGRNLSFDLPAIQKQLMEELSPREIEVLECLYKGMDTADTAKALFVSPNTVKFHLKNLFDKFGVHKRVELLAKLR